MLVHWVGDSWLNFIKEVQEGDEHRNKNVKFLQDEMEGRARNSRNHWPRGKSLSVVLVFLLVCMTLFDYIFVLLNLYFNLIAEIELYLYVKQ